MLDVVKTIQKNENYLKALHETLVVYEDCQMLKSSGKAICVSLYAVDFNNNMIYIGSCSIKAITQMILDKDSSIMMINGVMFCNVLATVDRTMYHLVKEGK